MSHQTKIYPVQSVRLYVDDYFFMRHVLAKENQIMTCGEEKTLRTVRINSVDVINIPAIKHGLEIVQHADRENWLFSHVV